MYRIFLLTACAAVTVFPNWTLLPNGTLADEPRMKLASAVKPRDKPFDVELVGRLTIAGDAKDLSGLTSLLGDGSPANRFGGLSAIEYSGHGDLFWLLPDRGAGDGEVDYACRVHLAKLKVESGLVHWKLLETRLFHWPNGERLSGSLTVASDDAKLSPGKHWHAFDPEGLRVNTDGNLIIADEYGPHIVVAKPDGEIIREFPMHAGFLLGSHCDDDSPAGVSPNRGLESLAVTAHTGTMLTVAQSPLIQDCVFNGKWYEGSHCRCLIMDRNGNVQREVDYRLDQRCNGICETLAIDENRFLILERDGEKGSDAKEKHIMLADFSEATDLLGRERLPSDDGPTDFVSAAKTLFIDMLDPKFGLAGESMPEKPEGLCWGPLTEDGRRTLWVCCDNDFDPAAPTEIYCFAISN